MNTLSLPISISQLLHGKSVEWERIEFKEGWNPEDILHTICAFANDFHNLGGGYIIVGIAEEDGIPLLDSLVGLKQNQLDKIQKELLQLGHSAIRPMYHPISVPSVMNGRHILVIWVPGGETRPYQCRVSLAKQSELWEYYIRKQSGTVKAIKQDRHELLSLAATVPFDDRYCQTETVTAFSCKLIQAFLSEVGSELADAAESLEISTLGNQMKIVGGPPEALFPKNVGLMFFTEHPELYFPSTQIDIVWLPDGAGGDLIEEKTFCGPLHVMVSDALDYINRQFLFEIIRKSPLQAKSLRVWNYPFTAIEEALVNAVYHRSYEIREPIEVRITASEISVLSFPGPDRSIRIDDLSAGRAVSRRYRNRRIGEFLKELNLTEGRATGIPKILRALKQNGSPTAIVDTDDERSYFLIRIPVHPDAVKNHGASYGLRPLKLTNSGAKGEGVGESTPEVTPEVPPEVVHMLSVLEGEMTKKQIMMRLALKDEKHVREHYLKAGLKAKLIEMTIPDKPRSSRQQYRLTAAGKSYQKS